MSGKCERSSVFLCGMYGFFGGWVLMCVGLPLYLIQANMAMYYAGLTVLVLAGIIGVGGCWTCMCAGCDCCEPCRKKVKCQCCVGTGGVGHGDWAHRENCCTCFSDTGGLALSRWDNGNVQCTCCKCCMQEGGTPSGGWDHSGSRWQTHMTVSQPAPPASSGSRPPQELVVNLQPSGGAVNEGFSGDDPPSYDVVMRKPGKYIPGEDRPPSYTEIISEL